MLLVDQLIEAGLIVRLCNHEVVVGDPVAIETVVARAATERVAHRRVGNAIVRQTRFQLCLNQGNRREVGTDRTLATAFTPASRSNAAKRSAGMLE